MKVLMTVLLIMLSTSIYSAELEKDEIMEVIEVDQADECIECANKEIKKTQSSVNKVKEDIKSIDTNVVQSMLAHYDAYYFARNILLSTNMENYVAIDFKSPVEAQIGEGQIVPTEKLILPSIEIDKDLTSDPRLSFNPVFFDFFRTDDQ